MPVTMRGPDGQTIAADDAKINFWVNQGYRPISEDEIRGEMAAQAARPEDRGFLGDVNAAVTSALSGATLGGSDVLLSGIMNRGQRERLAADINYAPVASTVGRIAGEVAPALLTGGESLAANVAEATPAAQLSRLSTAVGEAIPGTGAVSRVSRLAATGATEGAISNAGQYLGAMALQDKDASAEGFLASMKDGALYGGGAAGALGIAGEGLIAAKRLLPATELTPAAARRAREAAVQEVSHAMDDTRDLAQAGRQRARQIVQEAEAANPRLRAELDQIRLQKAKDLADAQTAAARARTAKLEADAAAAQSRAEGAAARAERAKNPPRRGKKAPAEEPAMPTDAAGEPIYQPTPAATEQAAGAVAETLTPSSVPGSPDDLIRQLQGTKDAIDNGTSLASLSARKKETLVEDAVNARVAQENPEMQRLLKHLDGLESARDQVASWLDKYPTGKVKSFEYTEGMRKQSGWRDVLAQDSQTPGFAEGSLAVPRGRQGQFLGDEAARQSYERGVLRRDLRRRIDDPLASATEKAEAQSILDQMDVESAARKAGQTPGGDTKQTAKQIVEATDEQVAAAPASVDDHVDRALNGHTDLANDVDDATEAIGALEQTSADLADELGPNAPPTAAERAKRFRDSQTASEASAAETTADAVSDAERAAKTIGLGDTPQARKGAGLLQRASEAGQVLEALKMLGVPVPDVTRLPVVGPLLSLYLKAKLAHRAVSRLGGKVPRTAETEIARRAADTKAKLLRAADRVIENTGRAATSTVAARAAGASASSVLSATLFDDRDPGTPERKTRKNDDIETIYLARKDELERAMAPGAVREAVRKRIRTADVPLLDAIAAAEERKLKFLYDKMPKTDDGVQVLGKRTARAPSRADLEQWSKYVRAAQQPAETLGAILTEGLVSAEAAETIRTVSPRLLQDVQQRIIEKAVEGDVKVPHRRRVQMSIMLGLPLDDSQIPEFAQRMGMLYQKQQPQAPAQGAPIDSRAAERVDPETRI